MKALVLHEPNEFSIEEVGRPEPGPHEVLCKVNTVTICGTDPHIIGGDYPGFWPKDFPFIPGHEWCGEVVELGSGAAELGWETGTRVAGTSHAGCGFCRLCVEGRYNLCENYGDERLHRQYGHYTQGSYADYVVHSVKSVFPVPDELSDEEAAMLDPTSIALHTVKRGGQAPGDSVAGDRPRRDGFAGGRVRPRDGRGPRARGGPRRPPREGGRARPRDGRLHPDRAGRRYSRAAPAAGAPTWRSSARATPRRWAAAWTWCARAAGWR